MNWIHEDPADERFTFLATYYGGDPTEQDKMRWVLYYPPTGWGGGLRHEDAKPEILRRYDRKASEHGIYPASTAFGREAGVWRADDGAERDHFLGSDYGDDVSAAEAREILVEWGYSPELLTADPVREPRRELPPQMPS
jgi:hypothetical protein